MKNTNIIHREPSGSAEIESRTEYRNTGVILAETIRNTTRRERHFQKSRLETKPVVTWWIVLRLFFLNVVCLAATAAPVVITFEEFTGTAPGAGTAPLLSNQYASKGVTFNGPALLNYASVSSGTFAHSGVNGIEQCYSREFCTTPFRIGFTALQARVKVWVGYRGTLTSAATVVLEGFNAAGTSVGSVTTTLAAASNPQPIRFPLELAFPQASISFVNVRFSPATLVLNGLALDDLEFDTAGPPPPCLSKLPPVLTLTKPLPGTTVQVNNFLLEGSVGSNDPLAKVVISVTTSAGTGPDLNLPVATGPVTTNVTGVLSAGLNTVSLRADNSCGSAVTSVDVSYLPIAATSGFQLLGMEITQAIQDMDHSVPLIAGKRAMVRVYLRTTGSTGAIRNVSGAITACRPLTDGSAVCGGPLPTGLPTDAPTNVNLESQNYITVDASSDLTAKRRDINSSLNFELPANWTSAGMVNFQISHLEIGATPLTLPCSGCDNRNPTYPAFPRYYSFQSAAPLRIQLVSVPYMTSSTSPSILPRKLDLDMLSSWLGRAYPAGVVDATRSTSGVKNGVPDTDFKCDDINSVLEDIRSNDLMAGGDSNRHYYGVVSDFDYATGSGSGAFMRGCGGVPGKTGSGPAGSRTWGWDVDGSYADWYGGHEVGHQFGRNHPGFNDLGGICTAIAQDPRRTSDPNWSKYLQQQDDPSYPFAGGLLSNSDLRYFGVDLGDGSLGLSARVYAPDNWTDMMTYCQSEWISSYTYEAVLAAVGSEQGANSQQPGLSDGLLVQGVLNLTKNTLELHPFSRMPGLKGTSRPQSSAYSIDLLSSTGTLLARYPFEVKTLSDQSPNSDETALLHEVVPYVAGTRRIVISKNNVELAARGVSPNAPKVTVLYPNGGELLSGNTVNVNWVATDADGDVLTYTVMYSPNAGQTWTTLGVRLTGTSYQVNLAELPGSDRGLFRVIATDGVNTGLDNSNAVFHVPFKAPQARIISPAANGRFSTAQTVILNGQATDAQDGDLGGASLQWTSDKQGALGAGKSIAAHLTLGTHVVTLKARNAHGDEGQATISLQVVDVSHFNVPGDVNGDGVVNCSDLDLVRSALGKQNGQPGFDSRADVNLDGIVNNQDVDFVSKQVPNVALCTVAVLSPSITQQPAPLTVCAGQPATFFVGASGSGLSYQWRKNNLPIAGAVSSSFMIASAGAGDAGSYSVVVSNQGGTATSSAATLTVNAPAVITSQPASLTRTAGQSATFAVTATGSGLRFQWRHNGGNIPGATSSSYTIASVGPNDAGPYYVVVYNSCATLNSAVATLAVNGANNAGFVTQSLTSTMVAGKPYNVSITMKNTGTSTWTGAAGYQLASANPEGNTTWGMASVNLLPASVAPGNSATFTFTVTAPAAPGAYHFQWRMMQSGAGFGDLSADVLISVTPSSGTNNSRFVIQNLPVTMKAGQSYAVSIKMSNSGTTTWTASGGYQLVAQRPAGSTTWGISRVDVPAPVAPGADVTFAFTITAPAVAGSYHFEWQVMQNLAGFGDFSPDVLVTVTP